MVTSFGRKILVGGNRKCNPRLILVSVTDMKLHANDKDLFSMIIMQREKRTFFSLSAGPLAKFT